MVAGGAMTGASSKLNRQRPGFTGHFVFTARLVGRPYGKTASSIPKYFLRFTATRGRPEETAPAGGDWGRLGRLTYWRRRTFRSGKRTKPISFDRSVERCVFQIRVLSREYMCTATGRRDKQIEVMFD